MMRFSPPTPRALAISRLGFFEAVTVTDEAVQACACQCEDGLYARWRADIIASGTFERYV